MTTLAVVLREISRLSVLIVAHLDEKVLHVEDLPGAFTYVKPINITIHCFEVLSLTSLVSVSLHFFLHSGGRFLLPRHLLVQFLKECQFGMSIVIGPLV